MMMIYLIMSKVEDTQNTGLIQFQELPVIAANAPEILQKNQSLLQKALSQGQGLLDTIQAEGMNDQIDAACNTFLVNCKAALEKMNGRRSPITKMFTAIAKEFTTLEAPLDSTKSDSLYSQIQTQRNAYAKQKEEIRRQKEAEILRKQKIEQEKIDLKAHVEQAIRTAYLDKLYAFKKKGNDLFNALTLENLAENKKAIAALSTMYPRDKFYELPVTVTAVYLTKLELASLIFSVREELYNELSANFRENMEDLKSHLAEQIPARKAELEEIAKASVAEKKRLQDEADRRQREEQIRIEREAEQAKKASEEKVSINRDAATANTLFDSEAEKAQLVDKSIQVRQGYKITVTRPAGYQQIAAYWFSKFLNDTPMEKLEKKSLGQMTSDLEKLAQATDGKEKVISEYIIYEEDFKALAKR